MEVNIINQKPLLINGDIGKCMIALCCKVSFDFGFDGYITFEAKNSLMPYYKRFGAENIVGLRMVIASKESQKLVDFYF